MCRRTRFRRPVLAGTAKLRRVKRRARALARHHRAAPVSNLKLRWTRAVQVRHAPRVLAVTGSPSSPHSHSHVVTVHETHVVEVLVTVAGASDRELHQRHRRDSSAGAFKSPGTVSGGAFSGAGVVKGASGPGPEAA